MKKEWRKLNGKRIDQPISEEIRQVILRERAASHELKVCIGIVLF
jgi:hypothetical protein